MTFLPAVNMTLSTLTVIGQVIIVVALVVWLFTRKAAQTHPLLQYIRAHALPFSFIVSLIAVLGSLYYSEIAQFAPCKLCWLQRIFMYPQVILLGIAWWKKDSGIALYSIVLAAIGGILAVYHYALQLGASPLAPCSLVGYSVSCSDNFGLHFGYITIPMMAATAFALIITLLLTLQYRQQNTI